MVSVAQMLTVCKKRFYCPNQAPPPYPKFRLTAEAAKDGLVPVILNGEALDRNGGKMH